MTALGELVRQARLADVELVANPPDRLRLRFDTDPPGDLLERLKANKAELLTRACPECGHVRGDDLICWRRDCEFRPCVHCGRNTGSQLISCCRLCQVARDRAEKSRPDTAADLTPPSG